MLHHDHIHPELAIVETTAAIGEKPLCPQAARVHQAQGHPAWQDWLLQLEALRYRPNTSIKSHAEMASQLKALRRALVRISA